MSEESNKALLIEALRAQHPNLDYGTIELCVDTWLNQPELVNKYASGELKLPKPDDKPTGESMTIQS